MADMQCVVLAGGLGTRLGGRAGDLPKYLVPVAGKPFAHWQLERLAASRFDEVIVCIGHRGELIRGALGDRFAGMAIRYADDMASGALLGTGGALRSALALLDESFLCTYGDSYLPFDYAAPLADLRSHPGAAATMAVYRNEGRWDRSNVLIEGDRVVAYRKGEASSDMSHIDYGAIALRRAIVGALPEGASDLADALAQLAARGAMRAHVVVERFYEIGSPRGLEDLEEALA